MAGVSGKYTYAILGNKTLPDDEPVFVIRGQDRYALAAISAYYEVIEDDPEVDPEFVHTVNVEMERFRAFQENNPDRVKTPD